MRICPYDGPPAHPPRHSLGHWGILAPFPSLRLPSRSFKTTRYRSISAMPSPQPAQSASPVPQIEDKLRFLKACIEQVTEQIHKREAQNQAFVHELEGKTCEVRTSIYALDQMGPDGQMGPRRTGLEREIKQLEKESRQQALECWRDVVALQRELRQLRKEYRAVQCSMEALSCGRQKTS